MSNAMLLLEGTSWKHQAREAVGAARVLKEVRCSYVPGRLSNGLHLLAHWRAMPQLKREAVRPNSHPLHR